MDIKWFDSAYNERRQQLVKNIRERQEKHPGTLVDLWRQGFILEQDKSAWHNSQNMNRPGRVQDLADAYGITIRDNGVNYSPKSWRKPTGKRLLLLAVPNHNHKEM
jgi:hypothetical protein